MSLELDEKLQSPVEVMETSKDAWAEYLRRGNPMKIDAGGLLNRLNELSPKLFSPPEKMQFNILDVTGMLLCRTAANKSDSPGATENRGSEKKLIEVTSIEQLDDCLSRNDVPHHRFMLDYTQSDDFPC
jgi:hypothetical protein